MRLPLPLTFSVLLVTVNIFLHFPHTSSEGWFQACEMSADKRIQATTCSKGIWLDKPMSLDCVCVKGVWALSTAFCDTQWTMLVGDGDCFQIADTIHSIKFMGKPDDPFASSSFTGPLDLRDLVQISGGAISEPFEDAHYSVVIGIKPKNPVQRSDKEICLTKGANDKPVHVYLNHDTVANQWQTLYTQDCKTPTNYQFHVDNGEMYKDSSVIAKNIAVGYCKQKCNHHNRSVSGRWGDEDQGPHLSSGKKQGGGNSMIDTFNFTVPFPIKPGSPEEKQLDCLSSRARATQDPKYYEAETKQQTIRMMGAHLKPLLLNVSAFEVNTKEYQYFSKAFVVFSKTCLGGSDESGNITSAISKMWGWLVAESHDLFTHSESQDDKMHERIMDSLNQCINNSTLKIREIKTDYASPESCIKNVSGASGVNFNGTSMEVKDNIPPYLKFDKDKFDLVVDVAWKIALITHYRCAPIFSNAGLPIELSYLMEKLQSFFNAKIIKRWHDSKGSWNIYKFMLFAYDLDSFSLLVDRCMSFSKELSEVQNWFLRPKVPCTENDLSNMRPKRSVGRSGGRGRSSTQMKQVWDSNGYCINQFMDPVKKLNYDHGKDCLSAKSKNETKSTTSKLGNGLSNGVSNNKKLRFRFGIHYVES